MGKISPVAAKYIVNTQIQIEGIVDRPDVIGAIFGQTEGLLGTELELRELQRSGRIGRIEVKLEAKSGKTQGSILIPSSLDKAETAIIAAALETIQRIGPCNAKVKVENIEDVRISKRTFVIERAKELLRTLTEDILPDSAELTEEVAQSVRVMEITEWGRDRLPAGPGIEEAEEIILTEGRADVLNLLKHGFKNVVGMNGTDIPPSIADLCKEKTVTLFVDGDRGGDLIIKELSGIAEIDYVAKAPDGKEVEEITKKEIHKAIRSKITLEQAKMEMKDTSERIRGPMMTQNREAQQARQDSRPPFRTESKPDQRPFQRDNRSFQQREDFRKPFVKKSTITKTDSDNFKRMLEDLIGTKGAYILDESSNILGKVPTTELPITIKSLGSGINAVIFDGEVTSEIAQVAESARVKYLVAMSSKVKPNETRVEIVTNNDF
ncbi:MAG TPA: DNA primase DnaG [Candidatus Nanoarchaeia archaeon]|nr:DNA primase DnaG [Candidatus Nanoarchaeia archaeon]